MAVATIEAIPLSDAGGAEIRGVDLSRPLDGATKAAVLDAWRRYSMLLFRDQDLDDEAGIRFCELFGEVQPERQTPSAADKHRPGIHYVANTRKEAILPDGDIWWHSDQIFYDLPAAATTLYCIDAPQMEGGETRFANCQLAYDTLDEAMKRKLAGLKAESFYLYNSPNRLHREAPRQGNELCATHPVIRTHPETGAKVIYVNRLMTDFIHGMDRAESDALLDELYDLCEQPRFCWQHRWREGDQIIWDNRNLLHCRNTYDHVNDKRTLRRIAIKGDTPY